MDTMIKRRDRLFLIAGFCILTLIMLLLFAQTASASESIWSGTYDGKVWDMSVFKSRILAVYSLMKGVCAPIAVCSIAAGAFEVLLGNEREQAKGMARIKYTFMAVMALYLLPAFINMGYSIAKNYAWDPYHPDIKP